MFLRQSHLQFGFIKIIIIVKANNKLNNLNYNVREAKETIVLHRAQVGILPPEQLLSAKPLAVDGGCLHNDLPTVYIRANHEQNRSDRGMGAANRKETGEKDGLRLHVKIAG